MPNPSPRNYLGPDRRYQDDPCSLLNARISIGSRVVRLLFFTDLRAARLMIAFASILWGVLMIVHSIRGEPHGPTEHIHGPLFAMFPPLVWATVFFACGVAQMAALFTFIDSPRASAILSAGGMVLWLFAAMSALVGPNLGDFGSAAEISLAITSGWIWIRQSLCAVRVQKGQTNARQS